MPKTLTRKVGSDAQDGSDIIPKNNCFPRNLTIPITISSYTPTRGYDRFINHRKWSS